jgi:hypothetical protein
MTAGYILLHTDQVNALLADPLDGTGPCQMRESLHPAELASIPILQGARLLMGQMADGGAKLTVRGNLTRKLVEMLMDGVAWPGDEVAELRAISKVFNEWDFGPAEYLHALLRVAKVARHEKGLLKLSRAGRALLSEDQSGRLNAHLLRTTFTRYNLGYLDRAEPRDHFAPQIGVILFLIGQFCTHWMPEGELMRSVTLPEDQVPPPGYPPRSEWIFSARILRYLCWFGLIEEAEPPPRERWSSPPRFRKTPLYDRVLAFALPPESLGAKTSRTIQ